MHRRRSLACACVLVVVPRGLPVNEIGQKAGDRGRGGMGMGTRSSESGFELGLSELCDTVRENATRHTIQCQQQLKTLALRDA